MKMSHLAQRNEQSSKCLHMIMNDVTSDNICKHVNVAFNILLDLV